MRQGGKERMKEKERAMQGKYVCEGQKENELKENRERNKKRQKERQKEREREKEAKIE